MLLRPFAYHRPTDVASALALLEKYGDEATPIAGGTELLVALKARVLHYEHVVDLKHIGGLRGIALSDGALSIGALTSHFTLATDPLVRQELPAYAALSDRIANIRVRVAGTIGGNLCFAEPHADPPALLAALGASVTLACPDGERSAPVDEFIEGDFSTSRRADEIMTHVCVPLPPPGAGFAYDSFGHLERPAVGVAAGYLPGADGPAYRVWVGAICGRPVRLDTVEDALRNVPPKSLGDVLPAASRDAASRLDAQSDLHGSADYKQHLAGVLVDRVVRAAVRNAEGRA